MVPLARPRMPPVSSWVAMSLSRVKLDWVAVRFSGRSPRSPIWVSSSSNESTPSSSAVAFFALSVIWVRGSGTVRVKSSSVSTSEAGMAGVTVPWSVMVRVPSVAAPMVTGRFNGVYSITLASLCGTSYHRGMWGWWA